MNDIQRDIIARESFYYFFILSRSYLIFVLIQVATRRQIGFPHIPFTSPCFHRVFITEFTSACIILPAQRTRNLCPVFISVATRPHLSACTHTRRYEVCFQFYVILELLNSPQILSHCSHLYLICISSVINASYIRCYMEHKFKINLRTWYDFI